MNPVQLLFLAFDLALAALSLRSIVVLRGTALWTSAGWAGTIGYCIAAIVESGAGATHQPAAFAAYAFLVLLAIAFVVAGVRDEPQAEPWYWPARAGLTRAQKRASSAP